MSLDNVIAFWREVQEDSTLQQKLQPLTDQSQASRCAAAARIAAAAGFPVTADEMQAAGSVVVFWQKVETDAALRTRLASAGECETPAEAMAVVVRVAREADFELSTEALSAVTTALVEAMPPGQRSDTALSDEMLDLVSGGARGDTEFHAAYNAALAGRWGQVGQFGPGPVCYKP